VFEDTNFSRAETERLRTRYQVLVTASSWNQNVLVSYGLGSVLIHQGIDATLFQPGEKQRLFGDRLVVFSGGKLEYRKGQDLTIAAFKKLLQTEPDALLVTAWHNHWPELISGLEKSPHIAWTPGDTRAEHLQNWLCDHGIPARNQHHLDPMPNAELPQYLHSADVAVFPSRAEGGTNLCAMECMAAGIPTFVSANTGHLDLASHFVLLDDAGATPGHEGWGETDIEALVDAMGNPHNHVMWAPLTGFTQAKYAQDLLSCITRITEQERA
jgi:glycosyltransferase involved in cell wall biosynthesis